MPLVLKKTKSVPVDTKTENNCFPKSALQVEVSKSSSSDVCMRTKGQVAEKNHPDPVHDWVWVWVEYLITENFCNTSVDHHVVTCSNSRSTDAPGILWSSCHLKHKHEQEQHVCVQTRAEGRSPCWQVYTKESKNKTNTAECLLGFRCHFQVWCFYSVSYLQVDRGLGGRDGPGWANHPYVAPPTKLWHSSVK